MLSVSEKTWILRQRNRICMGDSAETQPTISDYAGIYFFMLETAI